MGLLSDGILYILVFLFCVDLILYILAKVGLKEYPAKLFFDVEEMTFNATPVGYILVGIGVLFALRIIADFGYIPGL